jgi:ferredoxin
MADRNARLSQNVPGPFYVDSECIGCTQCVAVAEGLFGFDEDNDVAFVKKQPEGDEEEKLARQAIEECPVQAIGDDG